MAGQAVCAVPLDEDDGCFVTPSLSFSQDLPDDSGSVSMLDERSYFDHATTCAIARQHASSVMSTV